MGAIAGLLARHLDGRPDPRVVGRFSDAMAHRGPDGEGFYADGPIALGHRRLAVHDLTAAGSQPIFSEDGGVVIVVDGEIYNHEELRDDLVQRGHRMRGRSDAEVVAHLYEEVGDRLPGLLRGMFALAVWDRRARRLLLARDRAGEKPLYYGLRPDGLAFASELGGLLADPGTPADLRPEALDAYLALQYVPSPWTIFRAIHKLPPAHMIVVGPGEPALPRPYATTAFAEVEVVPPAEATRRVRAVVAEAVQVRLQADVPVGAFLSGGVDSSIVVACMARASSRPVKTFSVGFEGDTASELPYARMIARRFATEHHELIVRPDVLTLLPSIVRHHGEPFADPSAVPTRVLCELTRRHVTVALSGDGGGESFGGYRRYVWAHVAHQLARVPLKVRHLLARGLGAVPGGGARWLRAYAAALDQGEAARYLGFVSHFAAGERAELYTPDLRAQFALDLTAERFAAHLAGSRVPDPLGRLMDLDVQTHLPDGVLTKVDVASMACSLEARTPLVDHQVMGLAASLPASEKIHHLRGKRILRRAFADLVPWRIRTRRTRELSLPLARWFRQDLYELAADVLLGASARARGMFRIDAVEHLLARHRAGEDHGDRLWNLLVLELWFREVIDRRNAGDRAPEPLRRRPDPPPEYSRRSHAWVH